MIQFLLFMGHFLWKIEGMILTLSCTGNFYCYFIFNLDIVLTISSISQVV
jgi:hypothetical protein